LRTLSIDGKELREAPLMVVPILLAALVRESIAPGMAFCKVVTEGTKAETVPVTCELRVVLRLWKFAAELSTCALMAAKSMIGMISTC
jgi:hypothetical protein